MKYEQLKNFGELHTCKASARVQMSAIKWLSSELGMIKFSRFLAKMLTEERHLDTRHFRAAKERGITNDDFFEGTKTAIATYDSLLQVCGTERGAEIYNRFSKKQGVLLWEDFIPAAEDFLRFSDPWEGLRQYFLEYFRVNEREGLFRLEVVRDSESELYIKVTDCAWFSTYSEAGHPEAASVSAESDVIFLQQLLGEMGGDFKRDSWLCRGDVHCDWHFYRQKTLE